MSQSIQQIDDEKLRQLVEAFDAAVGASGKSGISGNPSPFSVSLIEEIRRLVGEFQPVHVDPNINHAFVLTLVAEAWLGCLPRAKLFRPLDEKDGAGKLTNDEQRREKDRSLREWGPLLAGFFERGRGIAQALREGRKQPVYDKWLQDP